MELRPENRMEQILAGENITPENRAEAFTKEAIDNAGGGGGGAGLPAVTTDDNGKVLGVVNGTWDKMKIEGGDEYETVAEIAVGKMGQGAQGLPADWWYNLTEVSQFEVEDGDVFYFNDTNHPSDGIFVVPNISTLVLFNCKEEDGAIVQIDDTAPSYTVIQDDERSQIGIASSYNISNTTVTILKKVSGGGSITVDSELDADSENPVQNKVINTAIAQLQAAIEAVNNDYRVDIEPVIDEQTQQPVIKANKSIADIYAAAVAGKHVWAYITIPGITTTYQRMEITQYAYAANTYQVIFGAVQEDDGAAKPVVLIGSNTNAGEPADDSWDNA